MWLQVDSWSLSADAVSARHGEIAGGDKGQWEKLAEVRRARRDGWISQGAEGKARKKGPNVTAEGRTGDFCTLQGQQGLGIHLSKVL